MVFSPVTFLIADAIDSYIEDALTILVSLIAGTPLLIALRKVPKVKYLLFS
ncbi:MAG: hypothetical protein QXX99_07115 [Candidatus Bathyarchaeia archaeon]